MNAYEYLVKLKNHVSSDLREVAKHIIGVAHKKSRQFFKKAAYDFNHELHSLKDSLKDVFSEVSIGDFINQTIQARSEYERLDAVLTNTFQSASVGEGALNMLTNFAAKTPFQLNELTDSFVKLVNHGFAPAESELTKMGDLAASQGKSFGQLTEAILNAETNNFESLEEFGIKAKKSGNQVELSFKGVKKTVDASGDSVRNAILEYGAMNGVAGSMETISKTLGGRISNLKKSWNMFLVAVGGESNSIFLGFIDTASNGLAILTDHLPQISMWFNILWSYIEPVGTSFSNFFKQLLDFETVGDLLSGFGNVMLWVLTGVDVFTTGLITVIDWLTPFADVIGTVTGLWWLLNIAMAASPLTLIIISIIGIITAIGFVQKYTSGWANSWKATINGIKLLWQQFSQYILLRFITVVNKLMTGIDKIRLAWQKAKEFFGIGDSSQNQQIIADISRGIEARKEIIKNGYKQMFTTSKKAADEFAKVGITVDKKAIADHYKALKGKFSGLGVAPKGDTAYEEWLKRKQKEKNKNKLTQKGNTNTIVSGGKKMTHINITIHKLQDDTKIYVDKAEKGIKQLGDKVQEQLLRSVNSINQMQSSHG